MSSRPPSAFRDDLYRFASDHSTGHASVTVLLCGRAQSASLFLFRILRIHHRMVTLRTGANGSRPVFVSMCSDVLYQHQDMSCISESLGQVSGMTDRPSNRKRFTATVMYDTARVALQTQRQHQKRDRRNTWILKGAIVQAAQKNKSEV